MLKKNAEKHYKQGFKWARSKVFSKASGGLHQGLSQGRKEKALRVLRSIILKRFGSLSEWLAEAPDGCEFESEARKILGLSGG